MSLVDDASEKLRETKYRIFLPMRSMISAVTLALQAHGSLTEPLGLPLSTQTHTLSFCVLEGGLFTLFFCKQLIVLASEIQIKILSEGLKTLINVID